jgi:hypothetical protein
LTATACGESSGVAEGATVSVYVSAPLCAGAKEELASRGRRAGSVRVRVACLRAAETAGRLDLARIGAGARRATEDSAAVGYVEPPGREAAFSRPILEEAAIGLIVDRSGAHAMAAIHSALESRGEMTPREAVKEVGR